MGISTGFCTVGNFGSQDRMDYTIIGNEVNLASRLESAAEPGSILLANETNALVQEIVLTEEQPPITVKAPGTRWAESSRRRVQARQVRGDCNP